MTNRLSTMTNALLALLILAAPHCLASEKAFVIHDGFSSRSMAGEVIYLEDSTGNLSFERVRDPALTSQWLNHSDTSDNNFGYTNSTYWYKLSLINQSSATDYVLEIAYPVLDFINIDWLLDGQLQQHFTLGDKYPFKQRIIEHRNFLVPLSLPQGKLSELYMSVKTSSSMQLPLILRSQSNVLTSTQEQVMRLSIYYGMIIVMVLYNLFVFFSVREINYLYYVCYVLCMLLFLASLNGVAFQYLWPDSTWWNDQSLVVMLAGVIFFAGLFTRRFLDLPSCRPRLNIVFLVSIVLGATAATSGFLLPYQLMIESTIVVAIIAITAAFVGGIVRYRDGYGPAKYYLYAWSFMLFGGLVLALNKAAFLPRNIFTENAVQLGSAIEVILLSLALAERLNAEKTERYEAQQYALEVQKQATENLEHSVQERTAELEAANHKLHTLSTTDALTQVRNRRFFDECLEYELARSVREQQALTVMLLDIDHFKAFNDKYGHLSGDDCITAVAQAIQKQLRREIDIVARYGGEEFSVLLANTHQASAKVLAEQIRQAIRNIRVLGEQHLPHVTISIGLVSQVPLETDKPTRLLELADRALYRSKRNGRDCVSIAIANDDLTQDGTFS